MRSSDLVNAGLGRFGRASLHLAAVLALIGLVATTACGGDGDEDVAPKAEPSGDGSPADGAGSGVEAEGVGDCVVMEEQSERQGERGAQPPVERVAPCQEPHHYEVVGIVEADAPPGAPYPAIGTDAATAELQRELHDRCIQQFERYSGRTPEEAAVAVLTRPPDEPAWSDGDRQVRCIATRGLGTDPGGGEPELEGSLRRS